MMNSRCGSSLTSTVSKKTAVSATATVISEACQFAKMKSG